MVWFGLALVAAAAVAAAWNAHTRQAWRALAADLQLPFSEESYWLRWSMRGTMSGCAVSVIVHQPRDRRRGLYTAVTVQPDPAIDVGISLRAEDLRSKALKLVGTDDDQIGDPAFDQMVLVEGPAVALLGVLNQPTRSAMQRVLRKWPVHVQGGAVYCDYRGVLANTEKLRALLKDMVGLARRLRVPNEDALMAVRRTMASDPHAAVRRRCLDVLLARPGPVAQSAAQLAMGDADPDLRRLAALAAGPEGFDTLVNLLRDRAVTAADADTMLDTLMTHAPSMATAEITRIVDGPPRPASAVAVRAAAQLDLRQCVPRVNALAAHPDLGRACADALKAFDDPATEPGFIALLAATDAEVQRDAIAALGRLGTRAALAPLRQLQSRRLKLEARAAVEQIMSRLSPGGSGGLALVDDAHGGLSPIAARAGSLSDPVQQDET